MRRARDRNDDEDDYTYDEDDVPLHRKRAFGAGLKRTKVDFVPASEPDHGTIAVAPKKQKDGSSVGDIYASIVLKSESSTSANVGKTDGDETPLTCPICSLPILTTVQEHEATLAHQVSLSHSHPPSHLDRSRMGLRALASQGWDPDARIGLGREGEGVRFPIKAAAKEDNLGIGATVTEEQKKAAKVKRDQTKSVANMTTRERKALAEKERKRHERLQAEIYGRIDVDEYLRRKMD